MQSQRTRTIGHPRGEIVREASMIRTDVGGEGGDNDDDVVYDDSFLDKVYEAAKQRDASQLKRLLEWNDATIATTFLPSLDHPLLPCTPHARHLLKQFNALQQPKKQQQHTTSTTSFHAEMGRRRLFLQALLTIPSSYETPWMAICDFVISLHNNNNNSSKNDRYPTTTLEPQNDNTTPRTTGCAPPTAPTTITSSWILTCLADVQIFLQQAMTLHLPVIVTGGHCRRHTGNQVARAVVQSERSTTTTTSTKNLPFPSDMDNDTQNCRHTTSYPRPARFWILKLTKLLMAPLLVMASSPDDDDDDDESTKTTTIAAAIVDQPNDSWNLLPLELVTTLLSLARTVLDDQYDNESQLSIFQSMIDIIIVRPPQKLRPDRVLAWARLVSQSGKCFNSANDLELVRTKLLEHLQPPPPAITTSASPILIPLDHFPGLAGEIMAMADREALVRRGGTGDDNAFVVKIVECLSQWQRLLLRLLLLQQGFTATSTHPLIYGEVEQVLQSKLMESSKTVQEHWVAALESTVLTTKDDDNYPKWVLVNLMSISMRSMGRSGPQLAGGLLDEALGKSKVSRLAAVPPMEESLVSLILNLLSNGVIIMPPQGPSSDNHTLPYSPRMKSEGSITMALEQLMDGVSYSTTGQFQKKGVGDDDAGLSFLSNVGTLVWQSINLVPTKMSQYQSSHDMANFMERADWWIQTAHAIIVQRGTLSHIVVPEGVLAIAVLTTVYVEAPSVRRAIMTLLMESLSSESIPTPCKLYYSITLSMMIKSLQGTCCDVISLFALPTLPIPVFFQMADSLSGVPSARSALLSVSVDYLHATFPPFWGTSSSSAEGGDVHSSSMLLKHQDQLHRGLFGLCVLINSQTWSDDDAITIRAWKHLSDVLVLNKPPIPLESRSWLYDRLQTFIHCQRFTKTSSGHLLRAILVRSLFLFQHDATTTTLSSSSQFVMERAFLVWRDPATPSKTRVCPAEDIVALARLILSLLVDSTNLDQAKAKQKLLFEGRHSLVTAALGKHEKSMSFNDDGKKAVSSRYEHQTTNNKFPRMALNILHHILDHIMSLEPCVAMRGLENRRARPLPGLKGAIREICLEESQELRAISTGRIQNESPSWLNLSSESTATTASSQIENSFLVLMNLSLCDFMVELLFESHYELVENHSSLSSESLRNRFLVLGPILRVKKRLESESKDRERLHVSMAMSTETVTKTAVEFFKLSSIALEDALVNGCGLDRMENIVESIITYCSAVTHLTVRDEKTLLGLRPVSRLVESIWQLFRTICDEESSLRFIAYLEASKKNEQSCPEGPAGNQQGSLRSLSTGSDIDLAVRVIRENILRALNSSLDLACSNHFSMSLSLATHSVNTLGAQRTGVSLDRLCYYAKHLAKDLHAGLEGNSGGVSEEMYLAYVDAIENCSVLLEAQAEFVQEWDDLRLVLVAYVEVATIVREIVCTFPLTGALVFKKTLLLSVSVLPSLHRHIHRRGALLGMSSSSTGLDLGFKIDYVPEKGAFSDCLAILSRWSSLRDPSSAPWQHIAGPDHAPMKDVSSIPDAELDGSDSIAQLQTNGKTVKDNGRPQADVLDDDERVESTALKWKLCLPSKETWAWAFSCLLLTMEGQWAESFDIMMEFETSTDAFLNCSRHVHHYCDNRRRELSCGIQSACSLLDSFDALQGKHNSGLHTPLLDMLAMHLPNATKGRLCSLLCRLSGVLNTALKLLCDRLHDVCKGTLDDRCDIASVESLCCISAWLMVGSTSSAFTSGPRSWYNAEKRKDATNKNTAALEGDKKSLLEVLPKVFSSVERLKGGLHRLQGLLIKVEKDGLSWPVLDIVGGMKQDKTNTTTKGLLHLVSEKLEQTGWKINGTLEYESHNRFDEEGKRSPKRKRTQPVASSKVTTKPRRQMDLRSRNRVIDLWLSLDDDIGEGADGATADAYVDLEDFLVFG